MGRKKTSYDGLELVPQTTYDGSEQTGYDGSEAYHPLSLYEEKESLKENPPPTTISRSNDERIEEVGRTDSHVDCESSRGLPLTSVTQDDFRLFVTAYPFAPEMSVSAAREAFETLSIKDRLKAIRFAKIYAESLKANNRKHAVVAVKWLIERRFDEIEQVVDAKATSAGLKRAPVFVAKGTDAWPSWVAHYQRTKGKPPPVTSHGDKTGWWFPSLFPPDPRLSA